MPTTFRIITLEEQTHCSWNLFLNLSKQSLSFLCCCNMHCLLLHFLSVWTAACGLLNLWTRKEGRTCLGKYLPQETCYDGAFVWGANSWQILAHSTALPVSQRTWEAKNHSATQEKSEEPNIPTT